MIRRRVVWTLMCALAVAFVTTITIVLSDLYLTGHGLRGLMDARFHAEALGLHLSIGDAILLSATVFAAALAWWTYDPTA